METLGPFYLGPNNSETNGVYYGDFFKQAHHIPDNSVDLCITDPVYDRINDYWQLINVCSRVLRPGGNLLVQSGKYHLPEILKVMSNNGLIWQTMIAEVYPRASGTIMSTRTMSGWKPYLWFSKGKRSGAWCFDRYFGKGQDKNIHRWGDSPEFSGMYIDRLTIRNEIILDPFTGGGTVPAVCKQLGRRYLAFDIDHDTVQIARERVCNTQPPLFVMQPEQLELLV